MFAASRRILAAVFALSGVAVTQAAVVVDRSVAPVSVREIASLSSADLVVLDGGFEAGLRQGMVCSVNREGRVIGEILLVDLRARVTSALIIDLVTGASLQSGDQIAVKTVSSRN